ncbi:MAG: RluA family pseudouridine synthase [Nitrospinae bacterium]|nr:RluA family pseudouridine synthase [Nitrospinota bacterium]
MTFDLLVEVGEENQRLDVWLVSKLEGVSRTTIQKMLKGGLVTVGVRTAPANHKTRAGERFQGSVPPQEPLSAAPADIPLKIVYEDDDIIIVDKEAGMVVHPAKGHENDTLVNALLFKGKILSDAGEDGLRPGIVHRLDKDTTGLIAIAKNAAAHAALSEQLKSREMGREYLAVVRGEMKKSSGTIDKPIGRHKIHRKKMTVNDARSAGSREAQTLFETVETFPNKNAALLKINLKTGRTHQIRVHLSSIGNPIIGDTVYGKEKTNLIGRPALHAAKLRLVHPTTRETMVFEAPVPPDFLALLDALRSTKRR